MPPAHGTAMYPTYASPVAGSTPPTYMMFTWPLEAAITFSGTGRASAPNRASAIRLNVTVRAPTGAGGSALTIVPGGRCAVIGR